MIKVIRLAAFAITLCLQACSPFQNRPAPPALHDFGLSEYQSKGLETNTGSIISVEAPGWLQNENMVYRLLYADPTQVRFYAQDRWRAPPSALLAQRLSLAIDTRDLLLKIRLLEFEQVFDGPQHARVQPQPSWSMKRSKLCKSG